MPVINGTQSGETLPGTAGADTISGLGGADTLNGGDGDDTLYGHSAAATGVITSTALVTGLSLPVAGASAPSDPGFIYIVEKETGVIWRTDVATGAHTVFLDIADSLFLHDGERGVLGLAFHPDYASNGRFFVYLTDAQGDIQVREFHRSNGNPAVADTTSSLIIEVPHPTNSNHNGGWLGFSPTDGYLYLATGDGGGGGDTDNHAQDLNSLLGKLLRIDVNSDGFPADATRNYAIPADNPFVGIAGADEIWAYGLRNPFRSAFDPRNGNLYIADVGQSAREEVDFLPVGVAGANFGWRIMEGNLPYSPGPPGTPQPGDPSLTLPIYDYGRGVGTTITGGEVYVGAQSSFVGQYVFADYGSGRLFSLSVAGGVAVDATDRTGQIVGPVPTSIVDFVTDSNGALYAIGILGTVWRLDPGVGAEDVGDTLNGGAGNDTLVGGAGADMLNGGADIDTANYAIGSTAATWTRHPDGSWTVSAGREGVDTTTSVEFLHFTDRDVHLDSAEQTFTGDGTSDLLLRNSSGTLSLWFVNGASITGAGVGSIGAAWTPNSGDFNGDGRDDILWRNTSTGDMSMWFMNGAAVTGASFGNVATNWLIENLGDFNGDGRDDILWRNTSTGDMSIWFLNGTTVTGGAFGNVGSSGWAVEDTGDFNGDGRDDILWRNTSTGDMSMWFMNGLSVTGGAFGNVGAAWVVEGTGDFNGDGREDIFWRNSSTGDVSLWYMNGQAVMGFSGFGIGDTWQAEGVGDYNGDGRDDILWRDAGGNLVAWYLQAGGGITGQAFGELSTDWVINPGG